MHSTANVYSFHGGIHPEQNKTQSLQLPLGRPSLPAELVLPLGQHIGQASRPLVDVGDKVLKGQAIAINNGFLSSFLHAPTSGTINAIEDRAIAHPSGLTDLCLVLTPDNKERWCELTPLSNWQEVSHTDVLAYLSEMGIVGMGGAGFPTQVKLQGAHKHPLSHLIINAAECEPYITADDTLIREKTLELVRGIQILQHLVDAENVLIGIEDNKPNAIDSLQKVIGEQQLKKSIQVVVVPTIYPSGGEKQLIKLLTNTEVPSGKHPSDIGILCQNVGTCVAIHDAIFLGKPLISRITTLTGEALQQPQNVEVLIGTPIAHLLEYAELKQASLQRLVVGGPMMGFSLENTQAPIVKTTNCILAASASELPQPAPEQACIRCGMCEQVCPASLLPQQLLWFTKSQEFEKAEHYNLFDCIECGACSYVCPSSIPLVQYYRHAKSASREAREATIKSDHAKQRFEARKARQEAEAAEKEAKRQARAKPAPKKDTASKAAPLVDNKQTTTTDDTGKKLKIDVAIAKAKLKKLEKSLLLAQEAEHLEEINELQLQITEQTASIQLLTAEVAKVAPVTAAPKTPSTGSDDAAKKLKIDFAIAKAAVKKIAKAVEKAQQINAPELETLLEQQQAAITHATELESALNKALAANATNDPKAADATAAANSALAEPINPHADQIKKQKIAAALAKAQINKLTKRLTAEPENATEIQQAIKDAELKQQAAEAELAKLINPQENN